MSTPMFPVVLMIILGVGFLIAHDVLAALAVPPLPLGSPAPLDSWQALGIFSVLPGAIINDLVRGRVRSRLSLTPIR